MVVYSLAHATVGHDNADHLGVNEWHGGRYRSLVQLVSLCRSYEVNAGRQGCCSSLLYRLGYTMPGHAIPGRAAPGTLVNG